VSDSVDPSMYVCVAVVLMTSWHGYLLAEQFTLSLVDIGMQVNRLSCLSHPGQLSLAVRPWVGTRCNGGVLSGKDNATSSLPLFAVFPVLELYSLCDRFDAE